MFTIEFYKLPSGVKPVEVFLDSLETKLRIKAIDSLAILEEFGPTLREPRSKYIGNGLFELRIRFSNDIARIFFFFYVDNKIIITNGFIKKTQKMPAKEIKKARKYKADYDRRNSHE